MKNVYLFILSAAVVAILSSNLMADENTDNTPPMKPESQQPKIKPPSTTPESQMLGEKIPDYVARWELARVLTYLEKYDRALQEYRTLLKNKPDLTGARVEMINVMAWTEDDQQQKKARSVAEKIDPATLDKETQIRFANALASLKLYSQAIDIYKKHLKNNPENLQIRMRLAATLSWDKQYDESLKQYELILKDRPEDIQIRRKYAFVLIWSGQHDRAAKELEKTLD